MGKNNITEAELLSLGYRLEGNKAVKLSTPVSAKQPDTPILTPTFPHWFIPGEVMSKKNGKRPISSGKMLHSKQWTKYAKDTMPIYESYAGEAKEWLSKLSKPYFFDFYFVRRTKSLWDYHNMLQGVVDMMQDSGWIGGDDIDHIVASPAGFHVDKHNPGVLIMLKNFTQRIDI